MNQSVGLTPEQMETLQKWLSTKTRGRPVVCVVCGQTEWTVFEQLVALRTIDPAGSEVSTAYPHVALSCGNCGHTILLNAVKSGLFHG